MTDLQRPVGGGFGPGFDPECVERAHWGQISIVFRNDGTAPLVWRSTQAGFRLGETELVRPTRPALIGPARD